MLYTDASYLLSLHCGARTHTQTKARRHFACDTTHDYVCSGGRHICVGTLGFPELCSAHPYHRSAPLFDGRKSHHITGPSLMLLADIVLRRSVDLPNVISSYDEFALLFGDR